MLPGIIQTQYMYTLRSILVGYLYLLSKNILCPADVCACFFVTRGSLTHWSILQHINLALESKSLLL